VSIIICFSKINPKKLLKVWGIL